MVPHPRQDPPDLRNLSVAATTQSREGQDQVGYSPFSKADFHDIARRFTVACCFTCVRHHSSISFRLTFDMSGRPKGAKRPLVCPPDGGVRCPLAHERNTFRSSANAGTSSCKVPDTGAGSHDAFEPTNRCTATSKGDDSSSNPAGTQTYDVLRSGFGTGEPHRLQKSERNPVGLTYDDTRSCPASQTNWSLRTMREAFDAVPLCLRQREQWHW